VDRSIKRRAIDLIICLARWIHLRIWHNNNSRQACDESRCLDLTAPSRSVVRTCRIQHLDVAPKSTRTCCPRMLSPNPEYACVYLCARVDRVQRSTTVGLMSIVAPHAMCTPGSESRKS
jgi:hypothetical protein